MSYSYEMSFKNDENYLNIRKTLKRHSETSFLKIIKTNVIIATGILFDFWNGVAKSKYLLYSFIMYRCV